jgi:hypothetical protein
VLVASPRAISLSLYFVIDFFHREDKDSNTVYNKTPWNETIRVIDKPESTQQVKKVSLAL